MRKSQCPPFWWQLHHIDQCFNLLKKLFFHIKEVSVKTKFQRSQNVGHLFIHQWNQDLISSAVLFLLLHYDWNSKIESKIMRPFIFPNKWNMIHLASKSLFLLLEMVKTSIFWLNVYAFQYDFCWFRRFKACFIIFGLNFGNSDQSVSVLLKQSGWLTFANTDDL